MNVYGYSVFCGKSFDDALTTQYCENIGAYIEQQHGRMPYSPRYGFDPEANDRAAVVATERWNTFEACRKTGHDALRFDGRAVVSHDDIGCQLVHATRNIGNGNSGAVVYEIFDKDYLDGAREYQAPRMVGIVVVAVCR